MTIDLFGNVEEVIRTLGFYQPFCSLMMHGKIETRWCRVGKKPPFPLGRYVLYSTLTPCYQGDLEEWCSPEIIQHIKNTLADDYTKSINGSILLTGKLVKVELMRPDQEKQCFVSYKGIQIREDKNGVKHQYHQVCLYFEDVTPIGPYPFKGKQGVGILTYDQKKEIRI